MGKGKSAHLPAGKVKIAHRMKKTPPIRFDNLSEQLKHGHYCYELKRQCDAISCSELRQYCPYYPIGKLRDIKTCLKVRSNNGLQEVKLVNS